jgi:hypothetical protein
VSGGRDLCPIEASHVGLVRKDSRHEEAPRAAKGMHSAGIKRVINAHPVEDEIRCSDINAAGGGANDDCRPWLQGKRLGLRARASWLRGGANRGSTAQQVGSMSHRGH